jgi:uncharacterized protein (DUF1330 family)
MTYYLVFSYNTLDQEKYEQYSQAVPQTMQPGMKALAVDHAPNNIEGEGPNDLVILEFDSEETAMRWYNSPEYQAIVHLRQEATEGWVSGAHQFVMPTS